MPVRTALTPCGYFLSSAYFLLGLHEARVTLSGGSARTCKNNFADLRHVLITGWCFMDKNQPLFVGVDKIYT